MAYFHGQYSTDQLRRMEEQEQERLRFQPKRTDGVYLFVLFPSHGGSNVYEVGKDCLMARRYMQNGRFVGIAKKVFSYGFESRNDEACVVLHFADRESALNFFTSDPNFKQPDFPKCAGHCQAWLVDRYYTPSNENAFKTFMISEIRLRDPRDFETYKEKFSRKFAELLEGEEAAPYVVQTKDCVALRRFCKDPEHIVTVHLFKDPIDVERIMSTKSYMDLMSVHDELAFEMCTVFTLERRPCP